MADLDKGSRARVRPVIISGEIVARRFDPETGAKEFLLAWIGEGGASHERWFKPEDLEADPAAAGV